jgi:nucleotide-binding universal stress UspA family protein
MMRAMKLNHIVLATDLLDSSRVALAHAAGVALATGAKLTLLHVDEIAAMGVHDAPEWEHYVEKVLNVRNRRLDEELEKLASWGVEANVDIVAGTPMVQVIEYARTHKPDLLVLAKHGRRGIEGILMGSVSRRIVRETDIPAIVVHAFANPEPGTVDQPVRYTHMVTPTDFSDDSHRGIVFTRELEESFKTKVTLVHVVQPPLVIPGFPGDAPIPIPMASRAAMEVKQADELRAILRRNNIDWETIVAMGNVPETIVDLAGQVGADLIVMPSHGHGRIRNAVFGSTTEAVLELSELPVLVLPHELLAKVQG